MAKDNTQDTLANLTGFTQQRISQYLRAGVYNKGDHPIVANRKIIAHLGKIAAGWQSQDGRIDRMAEAAKLDRARRAEIEIKLAEKQGALYSLESIVGIIKYMVLAIRSKFLALPSRMRSLAPDLTAKQYALLDQLVRDIISEFNSDRFPPEVVEATEQYFHRLHGAAETDDRPMGGPISDAESRE